MSELEKYRELERRLDKAEYEADQVREEIDFVWAKMSEKQRMVARGQLPAKRFKGIPQ